MIQSFPPLADAGSRLLILGTMPGEASLNALHYYAHPKNAFWDLVFGLYNKSPLPLEGATERVWQARYRFLLDKGIALWDVFRQCSREGSLDADITDAEWNAIPEFLEEHPGISFVFLNGATAEKNFLGMRKLAEQRLRTSGGEPPAILRVLWKRLPSSSPAHAGTSRENKQISWMAVRHALEGRICHETFLGSPLGTLILRSDGNALREILLPGGKATAWSGHCVCFGPDAVLIEAQKQLHAWFADAGTEFRLPLHSEGTPFQQRVWQAVLSIPKGGMETYADLALRCGSPGGARAVAQALRANPLPLIIPCHRVVGKDGVPVGFMGLRDNPMQQWLLAHERAVSDYPAHTGM